MTPTVIELNIDTVRHLNAQGIAAVYGDAERVDVLEEAGVREATALVLSVPGSPESSEIIRAARTLNPRIYVLARSAFMAHAEVLSNAGADQVFSGETEVANAMTKAILERLEA
jgi:CPA2 family monovalent cation:H+ antiporter-2